MAQDPSNEPPLGLPADALPVPEIYYDSQGGGKCFYMRNSRGNFIALTAADVKRALRKGGFSSECGKNQLVSQIDGVIADVIINADVEYAGPLAGAKAGARMIQNRRVLVTEPPHYIPAVQGGWVTLEKLLRTMLVLAVEVDPETPAGDGPNEAHVGEQQLHTLYGWLKIAVTTLRAGKRRPGQVLVIAGPPACGKSLLQNLITRLLGGRSAKPYQYMTGGTQFNSELFAAEHLMIEDEAASDNFHIRRTLGANLKGIVVNESQRCHPKGRQALTLLPFWRVSITLNDGAEDLMVLPVLDESVCDKVILLRAFKGEMPMPTQSPEQWAAFEALLSAELPGFLHFLLNEWQIPRDMGCPRYGVTHYHHAELLQMMSVLSPEAKLMDLIDAGAASLFLSGSWKGRASDLEAKLTERDSDTTYEARKLFRFASACGQYLGRLAKQHPERVSHAGIKDGYVRWTIRPRAASEDED